MIDVIYSANNTHTHTHIRTMLYDLKIHLFIIAKLVLIMNGDYQERNGIWSIVGSLFREA